MKRRYIIAATVAVAVAAGFALLPYSPEDKVSDEKKGLTFIVTKPAPPPTEEELKGEPFFTYTIYERPRDYPEGYVVRKWRVLPGKLVNAGVHAKTATLEEARRSLPAGLTCLGRDVIAGQTEGGKTVIQLDDQCIVETWL